jgi:hypothetical protein
LFYNGRAFFPVIHYALYHNENLDWVSKWAFIILEWIADFLSGNANCEFHPKKNINQLGLFFGFLADVP